MKRLAAKIDALSDKDEMRQKHSREMSALRRVAVSDLHAICADFVRSAVAAG